jgi:hypothetical protein
MSTGKTSPKGASFKDEVHVREAPMSKETHRLFVRVRLAIIAVFLMALCLAGLCGDPRPARPLQRDDLAEGQRR